MRKTFSTLVLGLLTLHVIAQYTTDVESFNYVLGTQTIGPKYNFTKNDKLVETAKAIYDMGSNILKISLNTKSYDLEDNYDDLTSLVRYHPSFKYAIDLPFTYYFFWAGSHKKWADGYSELERKTDSIQMYNLTKYLLKKYNKSGKTFFLGHWEGDWYLIENYKINYNPSDERCSNMIEWYRTRQNAIDKAKSDTRYSGVNVYHYAEVNRVVDAMDRGKKRIVNSVLPFTNVDYVSYSSYDAQGFDQEKYNKVLDYIESNLPHKTNITGKRVFIGEIGSPLKECNWDINKHAIKNQNLFLKPIRWGCPFVLYWEMYNNVINRDTKEHEGFWLIDKNNQKQPLYHTFSNFYKNAKKWVAEFKSKNGKLPSNMEYLEWAGCFLGEK